MFEQSLGNFPLGESGCPTHLFKDSNTELVAVASTFGHLYWPGRAMYTGHRLRHRLSLYRRTVRDRVAVFDDAHYPINDVAFHPRQPLIAVATGSYDGGYMFEGDLWLWNWEKGTSISLLGESREVTRCRFEPDGSGLVILLRPRNEEEFPPGAHGDAFSIFLGCTIDDFTGAPETVHGTDPRLATLAPVSPITLGFQDGVVHYQPDDVARQVADWARPFPYEERHHVWDVDWLSNHTLIAVHEKCRAEVWELDRGRVAHDQGDGYGVQVLAVPRADSVLVHAMHRSKNYPTIADASELLFIDRESLRSRSIRRFKHPYVFSISSEGWLLGRQSDLVLRRDRAQPTNDILMSPEGAVTDGLDLGHYDCFNHFLRLDGARHLYFLQGSPKSSHERKNLCELSPWTRDYEIRWPLGWGRFKDRHLLDCAGCIFGDSVVLACRVFPEQRDGYIVRRDLRSGHVHWQVQVPAQVASLVAVDGSIAIAYALTDGELGLLDGGTGDLLDQTRVTVDGVPTVVLSMSCRDARLAAGTIDGRLLIYQVG